MADNFDSNVASRRPTVQRRSRPLRPWDVPTGPDDADPTVNNDTVPDDDNVTPGQEQSTATPSDTVEAVTPTDTAVAASADSDSDSSPVPPKRSTTRKPSSKPKSQTQAATVEPVVSHTHAVSDPQALPVSEKSSDLSDSINIHSNYCKLDNDVSDRLLCRLSASAQSVYIRLYRQSFGWNRNWAAESLPKLSKSCNMSLQTIRKAIKELESIGCIRKEFSDYHKATVYRIFLPSEVGMTNTAIPHTTGLTIDTQGAGPASSHSPESPVNSRGANIPSDTASDRGTGDFGRGIHQNAGGQDSVIHSVYFAGSSIYALLESGGALPKNISIYITDKHLGDAVAIVDEFYDSIGFSVVARSLYRKSVLDYIDLVKSGFSPDDIRYSVRWTFKNSRSRPESFSLIKHTIHQAMKDLIDDLKLVSGQKEAVKRRQEVLDKSMEWEMTEPAARSVEEKDRARWAKIVNTLKEDLNDHSFRAFIEPIKLLAVGEGSVTLGAPPDFVSWINDHYRERIAECYRESTGKEITITIE